MSNNIVLTIDWASEFTDLDKQLSKKYNITITDNGRMEAMIEGDSSGIVTFLTSVDYGKSLGDVKREFPELHHEATQSGN